MVWERRALNLPSGVRILAGSDADIRVFKAPLSRAGGRVSRRIVHENSPSVSVPDMAACCSVRHPGGHVHAECAAARRMAACELDGAGLGLIEARQVAEVGCA